MERTALHDRHPRSGGFFAATSAHRLGAALAVCLGLGFVVGALAGTTGTSQRAVLLGLGTAFVASGGILIVSRILLALSRRTASHWRFMLEMDVERLLTDLECAQTVADTHTATAEMRREIEEIGLEMLDVASSLGSEDETVVGLSADAVVTNRDQPHVAIGRRRSARRTRRGR